jgi:hypothetical protein
MVKDVFMPVKIGELYEEASSEEVSKALLNAKERR